MSFTEISPVAELNLEDEELDIGDQVLFVTKMNRMFSEVQAWAESFRLAINSINALGTELANAEGDNAVNIGLINDAIDDLQTAMADEVAAREAAITALQSALDDEVVARIAGDETLQEGVTNATTSYQDLMKILTAYEVIDPAKYFIAHTEPVTQMNIRVACESGDDIEVTWPDGVTTTESNNVSVSRTFDESDGVVMVKATSRITDLVSTDNKLVFDLSGLPARVSSVTIEGLNKITGDLSEVPSTLKYLLLRGQNRISGQLSDLPDEMYYLRVTGSNTISGDIADLPASILRLVITGAGSITGNISTLPDAMTAFYVTAANDVTGDIANMPSAMENFTVMGSNTLYGDLADAPSNVSTFDVRGANTITCSAGYTPPSEMHRFLLYGGIGRGAADIENMLQGLTSVTTWMTVMSVDIRDNSGVTIADPSQSMTYIDIITANGATVLYNAA